MNFPKVFSSRKSRFLTIDQTKNLKIKVVMVNFWVYSTQSNPRMEKKWCLLSKKKEKEKKKLIEERSLSHFLGLNEQVVTILSPAMVSISLLIPHCLFANFLPFYQSLSYLRDVTLWKFVTVIFLSWAFFGFEITPVALWWIQRLVYHITQLWKIATKYFLSFVKIN